MEEARQQIKAEVDAMKAQAASRQADAVDAVIQMLY